LPPRTVWASARDSARYAPCSAATPPAATSPVPTSTSAPWARPATTSRPWRSAWPDSAATRCGGNCRPSVRRIRAKPRSPCRMAKRRLLSWSRRWRPNCSACASRWVAPPGRPWTILRCAHRSGAPIRCAHGCGRSANSLWVPRTRPCPPSSCC